jgi:hypothetical protein
MKTHESNSTVVAQNLPIRTELERLIQSGQSLATTAQAANILKINQQTLFKWACYQNGAIQPVRVGRALRWRLSDIAAIVAGGAK